MSYIAKLRKREGLSQKELAIALGVHVNSIMRWEKGYRRPKKEDILKLCDFFHVEEPELFYGPSHAQDQEQGEHVMKLSYSFDMSPDEIAKKARSEYLALKAAKEAYDAVMKEENNHDRSSVDHGANSDVTKAG